ncbi:MAG: NERD domain-containing protein [Shewanella sp.]|nr:NERD domain-containing protein [Shewanella sp.]
MWLNVLGELWPIALLVIATFLLRTTWFKGKLGEGLVGRQLEGLGDEYQVFHDITLPFDEGTTQIDHVVVSPYGIFVVETKNYKGWIYGSAKQKQWTQKIYRHSSKFQNPLHQNYKHIKALQYHLNVPEAKFQSVIVFVGSCQFKTAMPAEVTDWQGCKSYIRSFQHPVLSQQEIDELSTALEAQKLKPDLATNHAHRAHVKQMVKQTTKVKTKPSLKLEPKSVRTCPKCGSAMVVRTAKKDSVLAINFGGVRHFLPAEKRLLLNPAVKL